MVCLKVINVFLGKFLLFKLDDFLVILGSISNGQKVGAVFFFFMGKYVNILEEEGQNIYFGVNFLFFWLDIYTILYFFCHFGHKT